MPKYIVKGGVWGEGYEVGQTIELDTDAAIVRLAMGEIEEVTSKKAPEPKVEEAPAVEEPKEEKPAKKAK